MKYNIISINDDRKAYKDAIRAGTALEEVKIPSFNATVEPPGENMARRNMPHHGAYWGNPALGELGVWISNFDCWVAASKMDEPLIVFEDDAILDEWFDQKLEDFINDLPEDWDFAALWVPENQHQDYMYDVTFERGIPRFSGYLPPEQSVFRLEGHHIAALAYQGYGMVALVYSPSGARKLVELVEEYGLTNPVDCWIFEQAHMDNLKGYAPRPEHATIVHYDWSAETHVHNTERYQ